MANKKSTAPGAKKNASKVPLAPATSTPTTPPAIEQADGSPKPTQPDATPGNGLPSAQTKSSLRSYEIPDYRLERPEFRIFLCEDGTTCEYRIEGDLSATPPPIRESK